MNLNARSSASTYPQPHFWEALAKGSFELPRCAVCAEWQAPGGWRCTRCGSELMNWHEASGDGTVYSLMEKHTGLMEKHEGPAPFAQTQVIVVVELDEGPRTMGVMSTEQGHAEVGMRVAARRSPAGETDGLPPFVESVN